MYKRLGVSNTDIALYTSWLYLPWVIKPLWSPIVDMLGTRRHWVIAMQWALAAGFGAVALALPLGGWFCLSLAAFWIVAFLSATHDIAADGYYMLALSQERQSFSWASVPPFIALPCSQAKVLLLLWRDG